MISYLVQFVLLTEFWWKNFLLFVIAWVALWVKEKAKLHVGIRLHLRYNFFFLHRFCFLLFLQSFGMASLGRHHSVCFAFFYFSIDVCRISRASLFYIFYLHYKFDLLTWWSQVLFSVFLWHGFGIWSEFI